MTCFNGTQTAYCMSAYFGAITLPQALSSNPSSVFNTNWPVQQKSGPSHPQAHRQQLQAYAPVLLFTILFTFSEQVFQKKCIWHWFCIVHVPRIESCWVQTRFPKNCSALQGVGCSGWLAQDHMWIACAFAFCLILYVSVSNQTKEHGLSDMDKIKYHYIFDQIPPLVLWQYCSKVVKRIKVSILFRYRIFKKYYICILYCWKYQSYKKEICNQNFIPRLHRFQHYYKCAGC